MLGGTAQQTPSRHCEVVAARRALMDDVGVQRNGTLELPRPIAAQLFSVCDTAPLCGCAAGLARGCGRASGGACSQQVLSHIPTSGVVRAW